MARSQRPRSSKPGPVKRGGPTRGGGRKAADAPQQGRRGRRRPFPAVTLEDALSVPRALKINGGNPWPPTELAKALELSPKTDRFKYLASGAQDYGLTTGTAQAGQVSLAPLGRDIVYATSPQSELDSLLAAFFSVDVFKKVFEYFKAAPLPEAKYLQNTLETVFGLATEYHDDFVNIYTANRRFLEDSATRLGVSPSGAAAPSPAQSIIVGEPSTGGQLVAFVIMPFSEKTPAYPKGFFEEVLRSLITPAGVQAGFKIETAKREGSDVIHSTIVNDLLAADLVIADLTEHNPNVLFELGLRMASEKPTALIRALGTPAIFDVDNLLRVFDYDPNLWPSTIQLDLPKLKAHIEGTWNGRDVNKTYMQLLKP